MHPTDPKILIFFLSTLVIAYLFMSSEHFGMINLNTHLSKEELEKKIQLLQSDLFKSELDKQRFITELLACKQSKVGYRRDQRPTDIPFRQYRTTSNEATTNYTQIGFLYNETERFPLYGRHLYPGRSDRWEYFVIDESRNKLRIPFKTKNNEELQTGDNVQISTLNNAIFTSEIYEYDTPKYNPNFL